MRLRFKKNVSKENIFVTAAKTKTSILYVPTGISVFERMRLENRNKNDIL